MQIRNAFGIRKGLQVFSNKWMQKYISCLVYFSTILNTIDLSIVYIIISSSFSFETFIFDVNIKIAKDTESNRQSLPN